MTEKSFIFACKNEDLKMLKILIHFSINQDEQITEEGCTFNDTNWRSWLFGFNNVYAQVILEKNKKSTPFHLFIHEQKLISDKFTLITNSGKTTSQDLNNVKPHQQTASLEEIENLNIIHSLQSNNENLSQNLKVCLILELKKCIEFHMMNNRRAEELFINLLFETLKSAVIEGNFKTVKFLFSFHAMTRLHSKNFGDRKSFLHLALEGGYNGIALFLIMQLQSIAIFDNIFEQVSQPYAPTENDVKEFQDLAQNKGLVKIANIIKEKRSIWGYAAYHRDVDLFQFLLTNSDEGMKPYLNRVLYDICTSKDQANIEMAKLMVNYGINVNYARFRTEQPPPLLHKAIDNGHLEMVEFLVQNGANVNELDKNQRTPVDAAVQNEQIEIVQLLIQHGAEADELDLEQNLNVARFKKQIKRK